MLRVCTLVAAYLLLISPANAESLFVSLANVDVLQLSDEEMDQVTGGLFVAPRSGIGPIEIADFDTGMVTAGESDLVPGNSGNALWSGHLNGGGPSGGVVGN